MGHSHESWVRALNTIHALHHRRKTSVGSWQTDRLQSDGIAWAGYFTEKAVDELEASKTQSSNRRVAENALDLEKAMGVLDYYPAVEYDDNVTRDDKHKAFLELLAENLEENREITNLYNSLYNRGIDDDDAEILRTTVSGNRLFETYAKFDPTNAKNQYMDGGASCAKLTKTEKDILLDIAADRSFVKIDKPLDTRLTDEIRMQYVTQAVASGEGQMASDIDGLDIEKADDTANCLLVSKKMLAAATQR